MPAIVILSVIFGLVCWGIWQRHRLHQAHQQIENLESDVEDWQSLAEESNRLLAQRANEGHQLYAHNQYLQANSITIDPNNPLNVDAFQTRTYEVFERLGMYAHRENLEMQLDLFFGKDKNKRPRNLNITQLKEGMAVAWLGHPLRPPMGIAYLIDQYVQQMNERSYA